MIRKAIEADFEQILDLAADFWTHTEFEEPFEREHTVSLVEMAHEHGLLAVVELDNKLVGFAAGVKAPLMGNSTVMAGTELAWWVDPNYRGNGVRLLKFMEQLAKEEGLKYWSMVSMESSNPEYVDKIYRKMGYKLSETTYLKVI